MATPRFSSLCRVTPTSGSQPSFCHPKPLSPAEPDVLACALLATLPPWALKAGARGADDDP